MSDSVRFKESVFYSRDFPMTLEGVMRACGSLSGVHDYDFENKLNDAFANLDDWTTDALATWSAATGSLVATGGGSSIWYQAIHDTQTPPSFVASFDFTTGSGAFIFHAKTGANDCYIAWWDGSNCGFATVDNAKSSTDLIKMPFGLTGPGRMQVAISWRMDSVDEDRKWLLMALWIDGEEIVSFAHDIGGTAFDWTGDGVGFAVTDSDSLTVDNITISDLSRIVNYLSIDPGESPGQGMSRAIGTTRIQYFARFDGTMQVRRPGNRASDWTLPVARALRVTDRDNKRGTLTRVRAIGVLHSVDRFDDDEGDVHMMQFAQVDDPNLMSEEEIYDEAGYRLNEAKELQKPYQITIPSNVCLEPNDIITYDGVDYRVLTISHTMSQSTRGPQFVAMLEARRYYSV
jgi:hypothetical protein